ncbi:hypothetical protein Tsubulata_024360 [Turnera subulata]|uniref:RING-type domain-containing protein n=1 Tax=Turnera subulata TaxID=218843 RepID=A0A9Q0G617_9ROSI|nr:hypothetical protein Tsubulata_024360 [Turnera subulata]
MVIDGNQQNSFAKTICSICFEDLKPILEDLQSISICGHVFHELCLQQWFEYCPSTKKQSCPVCKQSCSRSSACRLYFQSVGDPNDAASVTQKARDGDEDPEWLRCEVERLESKLSGVGSVLERQAKEIKQLNDQLDSCNSQLEKEAALRNDTQKQKLAIHQLLVSKSEENDALKLERSRLQDRNMALAKELAALKLASDLNLEEDEVLKLASFGNEGNNRDTIEVLRRSLVIRNKSYKELMVKCNEFGRGEARSSKKLEKAKEKINKLKRRIHDLEIVIESKDNEALRALKVSKKRKYKEAILNDVSNNYPGLPASNATLEGQKKQHSPFLNCSEQRGSLTIDQEDKTYTNDISTSLMKEDASTVNGCNERNDCAAIDDTTPEAFMAMHSISEPELKHPNKEDSKSTPGKPELVSETDRDSPVQRLNDMTLPFGIRNPISIEKDIESFNTENISGPLDATGQHQTILNIRKESPSSVPLPRPGDICFSGGLLGPDGTNRYLGKWCKRGQSNGSAPTLGSGTSSKGDLIAVGADGRGGRIKVLRSVNQSALEASGNSASAKRCKFGTKTSSLQSKGCLQIEHFFGRASN